MRTATITAKPAKPTSPDPGPRRPGQGGREHRHRLPRPHADAVRAPRAVRPDRAAQGDLHVDAHHTVEDVAICLGQALDRALGDRAGIVRTAHSYVPMDEALGLVALDLSGRPYAVIDVEWHTPFARRNGRRPGAPLPGDGGHPRPAEPARPVLYGRNDHHQAEALFKALAARWTRRRRSTRGARACRRRRGTRMRADASVPAGAASADARPADARALANRHRRLRRRQPAQRLQGAGGRGRAPRVVDRPEALATLRGHRPARASARSATRPRTSAPPASRSRCVRRSRRARRCWASASGCSCSSTRARRWGPTSRWGARRAGLIPGRVVRFPNDMIGPDGKPLKVPQIGWNQLRHAGSDPLLAGVPDGAYAYFVHSYYCRPGIRGTRSRPRTSGSPTPRSFAAATCGASSATRRRASRWASASCATFVEIVNRWA